mgnify:FL=1
MTTRILTTWSADGLTVDGQIEHVLEGNDAFVLAAVRDRLAMGAVVIEVKRLTRRQAEKGSV